MATARCIWARTPSRSARSPTPSAYLEDGDWVVLTRKSALSSTTRATRSFIATCDQAQRATSLVDKANYRHFMAKEIHEQPEVVGHTLARYVDMATERVALPLKLPFDFRDIQRISITACGTASYAGYIAKYWFERLSRVPVELDVASEFRYREAPLRKGDLAIFISQSGETADTLAALRYAKSQGCTRSRWSTCRPRPSRAKARPCCRPWPARKSASPRPRPSPAS
jgi:glucosamine--fructose-6-phosphate aminotransferase (isomerizing)